MADIAQWLSIIQAQSQVARRASEEADRAEERNRIAVETASLAASKAADAVFSRVIER